MIPSLLPISTTNGSTDPKYVSRAESANCLKCSAILVDVDEKKWNTDPDVRTPIERQTVLDLARSYLEYADERYRREDGSATGEAANLWLSLNPFCELFGMMQVANLRPRHLIAYQKDLVGRGVRGAERGHRHDKRRLDRALYGHHRSPSVVRFECITKRTSVRVPYRPNPRRRRAPQSRPRHGVGRGSQRGTFAL